MATREFTPKARPGRNRPLVRPLAVAIEGERIREHLHNLVLNLRQAMRVVMVASDALRHQDAEMDKDIAAVLRCYASNKLDIEIEKTETLLAALRGKVMKERSLNA